MLRQRRVVLGRHGASAGWLAEFWDSSGGGAFGAVTVDLVGMAQLVQPADGHGGRAAAAGVSAKRYRRNRVVCQWASSTQPALDPADCAAAIAPVTAAESDDDVNTERKDKTGVAAVGVDGRMADRARWEEMLRKAEVGRLGVEMQVLG